MEIIAKYRSAIPKSRINTPRRQTGIEATTWP